MNGISKFNNNYFIRGLKKELRNVLVPYPHI